MSGAGPQVDVVVSRVTNRRYLLRLCNDTTNERLLAGPPARHNQSSYSSDTSSIRHSVWSSCNVADYSKDVHSVMENITQTHPLPHKFYLSPPVPNRHVFRLHSSPQHLTSIAIRRYRNTFFPYPSVHQPKSKTHQNLAQIHCRQL